MLCAIGFLEGPFLGAGSPFFTRWLVMGSTPSTGGCLPRGSAEGGQPSAGAWGVPRNLFSSLLPPTAASKKREKGFFGDTPNPGREDPAPLQDIHQLREHYLVMGEEKNFQFFSSPITSQRVVIPWGGVERSLTNF